jgi:adenylate cyclase
VYLRKFPLKKIKGRRTWRRLLHVFILLAIGVIFTILITVVQPFYTFNLWFADQFLETENPSKNIVIAGIDDYSLETYGKWSEWPRELHAAAIENLAAAGATVIGYDIVFADESPDDADFAAALADAGNVVLAAAGSDRLQNQDGFVILNRFLTPAETLNQPAGKTGHVNVIPDHDGKVRRIPVVVKGPDGRIYPSLGLAMLFTLFHQEPPASYEVRNQKIQLFGRGIPLDDAYFMRLNYAVTDNSLTTLSYADIISGNFEASLVKNKMVLVGMMATGDLDTWSIPVAAARVPGVLVHAAEIDTILRTKFLTEAGTGITAGIMLLLTAACAGILPLFGTWRWTDVIKTTGFALGLLAVYVFIAALAAGRGYILNVLYPAMTIIIIYVGDTIYMVIREQNDKKFVRDLFGRYVSPEVSRNIIDLAEDGNLTMGGEEKQVTIFFTDIRNFTTISEKMSPADVVKMLNICLPVMINAVTRNGGLVNKFAGDNLMGVWNAPQSQAGHAYLAVKAGWEAQQEMIETGKRESWLAGVHFGVGINTGPAIAGNVGSSGRSEYTVIGDAVNLASRICSVAPGGEILIGPDTYEQIKDKINAEPQPAQMFKGKSMPIVTYRVTGVK